MFWPREETFWHTIFRMNTSSEINYTVTEYSYGPLVQLRKPTSMLTLKYRKVIRKRRMLLANREFRRPKTLKILNTRKPKLTQITLTPHRITSDHSHVLPTIYQQHQKASNSKFLFREPRKKFTIAFFPCLLHSSLTPFSMPRLIIQKRNFTFMHGRWYRPDQIRSHGISRNRCFDESDRKSFIGWQTVSGVQKVMQRSPENCLFISDFCNNPPILRLTLFRDDRSHSGTGLLL